MKSNKLEEILKATHDEEVFVLLNGIYYPLSEVTLTGSYVVLHAKDITKVKKE